MFSEAPAHLAILNREQSKHESSSSKSATSSPVHKGKFAQIKSSSLTGAGANGSINAGDQAFVRLTTESESAKSRAGSFDRRDESNVLSELIKSMVECPDYLVPSFKFKHGNAEFGVSASAATVKNPLRKQAALNISYDGGAAANCYTDDFILLSEFSEIEGPRPLCTWPTDGATAFNKNEYALHLMCVDFNAHLNQNQQQRQTPSPNETADTGLNSSMSSSHDQQQQQPRPSSSSGSSSNPSTTKFQLTRDTSIINYWDSTTQIAACVHHFTLYDLEARGFVRPFCLAYISYDRLKPVEFFEQIRSKFHEITDLFKISNYNAFKHDLEQRCLDLRLTRQLFLKWSELYQTTLSDPHEPKANSERLNLIRQFNLDPKTCARLSASSMNESSKRLQIQAIDFQIKELEAIITYMKHELNKRNWLFVNKSPPNDYEKNCDSLMADNVTNQSAGNKKCSSAVDAKYNDGQEASSKLRSNTMSDDSNASLNYLKERQKFFKSKRQPYSLRFQRPSVFKNILIGNSNLLVTNHGPDDSFALSIDFHNLNKTSGPAQKKMKPLRELSYETIENAYEEIDGMYNYFSMPYYILKYRQLTLKSATSSHMFDRFKMVKYLTTGQAETDRRKENKLNDLERIKSKFNRNFNLFWSVTMGDCVITDFSLFIDEYNLNKYQLIKKTSTNSSNSVTKNRLSTSHTIVEADVSEPASVDGDDHQEARSRRMLKSSSTRLASSSLEPRSRKTNLSNIKVFVSQAEDLEVAPLAQPADDDGDQSKSQWYIDMDHSSKSRSSSTLTRKLSRKLLRNTAIDDTNQEFQDQSTSADRSNSSETKTQQDQQSADMSKTLFYSPMNVLSSNLMMENQQKLKREEDLDNESATTANRTNEMYSSVCESESLRTTLVITKPEELDLSDDDSINGEVRDQEMNELVEYASPKSLKNFEQLEQFLDFDDNDANLSTVAIETGGNLAKTNSNSKSEPSLDFYNELVSNELFTIKNYLETAICPNKTERELESEKKFKFIYEDYETSSEGAPESVDGKSSQQPAANVGQVAIEISKPPDSKHEKDQEPAKKLSPAELKQLMFLKTQREENEYDFVNFLLDNENRKYASMAMDTDIKFLKRIRLAYDQSRRLNENFFHITVDDVEGRQSSTLADQALAKTGELTLTDKLLKLSEYNFEETLKQLLNSSSNLMPHLLYALLKGRPVVCVSRYCEGYEQLKMILSCLSNFIPNSFHILNNLTSGTNSSSSASSTSIPVFTGAPPFLTRSHELEASKNMNFNSEMTTPQLSAIFERKRIRLNDLKYCKLIGLSLCIVKDGNCCSAICCSNNNKLINSNSFRTSVGGYSDSISSSNKSDMFASLSTNSTLVINSTSSSAMSDNNNKLAQSQRKNSAVHSMCHKHPHYHLNSKMTPQIIDDQLLNYIPITIRNYVSIFDLDKQTYLGPKYKGTLLNSFHSKAKNLQQDSISYLYLLDRIMQHYIKMAFIYNYSILFDSLNYNLHQVTHQRSLDRSDSQARSQPKSINSDKTKKRERLMNFYNVIIGNNNNNNSNSNQSGGGTSTGSTSNLNAPAANRSRSGSLTQSIASYATAFLGSAAFAAMTNPTTTLTANSNQAEQVANNSSTLTSSKPPRGQMVRAVSAAQSSTVPSPIEPISSLELLRVILSNIMTAQIPSLTPDQLATISATGSQPSSVEFDMCDIGIILNILRTLKVKQVYLYNLSMKRRKLKEDKKRLQDQMKRAASYSPPVPDFELETQEGSRPSITKSFDDSSCCNVPRIDVIVSSHDQTATQPPDTSLNISSSLGRPDDLSYYKQSSLDHTQHQLTTNRKDVEHQDQFQFPLTIEYEELVLFGAKK